MQAVSQYMQEVRRLIPVTVNIEDLITLAQAADVLGVSIQAVAGAVDGGAFDTVIIDTSVPMKRGGKGRRLLLRGEVMERKIERV